MWNGISGRNTTNKLSEFDLIAFFFGVIVTRDKIPENNLRFNNCIYTIIMNATN